MKSKVFTLLVLGAFGVLFATNLEAAPSAGGLFPDSFTVTCADTATIIRSDKGQQSYQCYVPAAGSDVYVGDSGVTTSEGTPYSALEKFGADLAFEYCIVSTGTQVIRCRAQVLSP